MYLEGINREGEAQSRAASSVATRLPTLAVAGPGGWGLGAGRQQPTGHRAALARGRGARRAESGLIHGREERISTSSVLPPRAPRAVFFSSQSSSAGDLSRRSFPSVLCLGPRREPDQPHWYSALGREDFLRRGLGYQDSGGQEVGRLSLRSQNAESKQAPTQFPPDEQCKCGQLTYLHGAQTATL